MITSSSCILCAQKTTYNSVICSKCIDRLPINQSACDRCGVPIITQLNTPTETICEDCFKEPPPFLNCFSPYLYQFPLNQLVSQMKYGNRPQLAKLLGQLFLLRLQADLHNQQPYPQLLVPIPMHTAKQRRRGFNQSIYVAQTIGRDLKIPVTVDCLRKAKLTDAQKNLNRTQRLHNLKNSLAFNPRYKKAFAHIDHVALVDDVITTGATMYEASRILKEQGVARVDIWALARTP